MPNDQQPQDAPIQKFNNRQLGQVLNGFSDQRPNQPYIVDLVTMERLNFQCIPLDITVNVETSWQAVEAAGRNLPLYQYTGGEDSIQFDLSWYANEANKQDVIRKCKWLVSLSRNDGYANKPHPLKLIFGDLFKDSKWIMFGAAYKISLFDRSKGMMPCLATQQINLKRISESNPTRADILNIYG